MNHTFASLLSHPRHASLVTLSRHRQTIRRYTRINQCRTQPCAGELLNAAVSETNVSLAVMQLMCPAGGLVGGEVHKPPVTTEVVGKVSVTAQKHRGVGARRIYADEIADVVIIRKRDLARLRRRFEGVGDI